MAVKKARHRQSKSCLRCSKGPLTKRHLPRSCVTAPRPRPSRQRGRTRHIPLPLEQVASRPRSNPLLWSLTLMAIAALGIELERRWGADRYEPAEEPAADRKTQSAVLNRAAVEGNEQKTQDATETTDNPADKEPIGKPRQRLSSGGADGASLLARSSEASAAQTLGDKQGRRSTSTAEQLSRTTTPSLGFIGRSEGRGGAIAASTGSTSTSPQASSSSGVQISGSFDNILIKGLSDNLYFGIGIEGGDNIQVTVSEDYFVGSTKAASLF